MIVLDTNVLSELMRGAPDAAVLRWSRRYPLALSFTTAVTRAELRYGALILPAGQRRERLLQEIEVIFLSDMAGRVLSYDSAAADAHADIAATRRAHGRPIDQPDGMIAGIARSHGAQLATRNVRDFEGCGIALVDPWH